MRRTLVAFFTTPDGPFNLAVFRIVFFASSLLLLPHPSEVADYSRLPDTLINPPQALGTQFSHLPISPGWVYVAAVLTYGGGILACLGIFTRPAAAAFVLGTFYYFGVTELYGKVDHAQHLLLIGAVFVVARSDDALSVSSAWRAWRAPEDSPVSLPTPRLAYSLPLRFVWLIMGCVYFFPGFEKVRFQKQHWLEPHTLQHVMWQKWVTLHGYSPPGIRIDHQPALLTLGAAMTLVFELGFIVAVLHPVTRYLYVALGIAFHNFTRFAMKISFGSLQACYVALIPWEWLSLRLFTTRRRPLVFAYDGGCGICRRTARALSTLALPGGVVFANALSDDDLRAAGVDPARRDRLLEKLHVLDGERTWTGFDAYRRASWRLPPMWPLLPFLYLPPVAWAGHRVYARVADARACSVDPTTPAITPARPLRDHFPRAVAIVGTLACLTFVYSEARHIKTGWPISIYPTFAETRGTTTGLITVYGVDPGGARHELGQDKALAFMTPERVAGLTGSILRQKSPERQRDSLRALVDVVSPAETSRYRSFVVTKKTVSTVPEDDQKVLQSEDLLTLRR